MVRLLRPLLGLAAVAVVLLVAPVPAAAHDELTATSPAANSTVTTQVPEVTLTFSGPVRADGSTLTVTGPDGQSHSSGAVSVVNTVAHQPVTPLSSGAYRVDWRVIAGDGDPMSGQFTFTLDLPAEPTTAPTTPPVATTPGAQTSAVAPGDDGAGVVPGWWVLAALVAVGLVVAAVVLSRRRGR